MVLFSSFTECLLLYNKVEYIIFCVDLDYKLQLVGDRADCFDFGLGEVGIKGSRRTL